MHIQTQLVLASVAEVEQVLSWCHNLEALQRFAGESFSTYPCEPLQFFAHIFHPHVQSYSLIKSDSGELLGFGQLCQVFEHHHLARIIIAPEHRNKGLSNALLNELFIKAFDNAYLPFSLYVDKQNSQALHLYNKMGFAIKSAPLQDKPNLHYMTLSAAQAIGSINTYLGALNSD